jgi:hypothetical protein
MCWWDTSQDMSAVTAIVGTHLCSANRANAQEMSHS